MAHEKNKLTITLIFFVFLLIILFPTCIHAEDDSSQALKEAGKAFLSYIPIIFMAAVFKLLLLSRKLSFDGENRIKVPVQTLGETFAEYFFFGVLFSFLSPVLYTFVTGPLGFMTPESKDGIFLLKIIVILPVFFLLATCANYLLMHRLLGDKLKQTLREVSYALLLSAIFPGLLITLILVGSMALGYTTNIAI
ncbi:MAG: hypothetical protein GY757_17735 [bacterium]|nr:hypothetical protein [bacterium]